jgi:hypothetical protein
MRDETSGENTPKKKYQYYYCRHCKTYFTINSYISSFCPFCTTPGKDGKDGQYFSLRYFAKDAPVRDRLFIAIPKCTHCSEAYRCPECFGAEKRNPTDCRICPCIECCNETIKIVNDVRSGRSSLWQTFMDLMKERKAKPGPMAKVMEREFEDEIPF